jgi:hypothetical protein
MQTSLPSALVSFVSSPKTGEEYKSQLRLCRMKAIWTKSNIIGKKYKKETESMIQSLFIIILD